jgi:hypothetical protein
LAEKFSVRCERCGDYLKCEIGIEELHDRRKTLRSER